MGQNSSSKLATVTLKQGTLSGSENGFVRNKDEWALKAQPASSDGLMLTRGASSAGGHAPRAIQSCLLKRINTLPIS